MVEEEVYVKFGIDAHVKGNVRVPVGRVKLAILVREMGLLPAWVFLFLPSHPAAVWPSLKRRFVV